jgi:hypothetical protein
MTHTSQPARISRRTFLAASCMGTVMAGASGLVPAEAFAQSRPRHLVLREDRFGRIVPVYTAGGDILRTETFHWRCRHAADPGLGLPVYRSRVPVLC